MDKLTLVIGNKNYSSWSLRAWLMLRQFGIDFEEVRIPLRQPDTLSRLAEWSPSLRVPVLCHGSMRVWDSLAICEYVSEQFLGGEGWPRDPRLRALARCISNEMHAGFNALREAWPMNTRLCHKLPPTSAIQRDISRIDTLWRECLAERSGGPWLFGAFSVADCMYAPVALRFHSYQPTLSEAAADYVRLMLANEHVREWLRAGQAEVEVINDEEVLTRGQEQSQYE